MTASYRRIDYRLRPAKSIERKMLAESFRKLSEFGRVEAYRYIGLGSIYFSDFSLFHKSLGFSQMLSIEDASDPTIRRRFEFNRPYDLVEMKFGDTSAVLPFLSWDVRTIIWLDYDDPISKNILDDIAIVATNATSGSMLLISVNANVDWGEDEDDETEGSPRTPIEVLKRSIGAERIPPEIDNKSLAGWGTASVCRTIFHNQIEETLKSRNSIVSAGARMKYEQLFNFRYSDGAKMLTVGGIFFDEAQEHIYHKCDFKHLEFYRKGNDFYSIDTPLLTFREMRALERELPISGTSTLPISTSDIAKYEKVYRYFPNFTETDI